MISHQTFLIKPSSSNCNLNCNYCFYHEIANSRECKNSIMSQSTMDTFLQKVFIEVTNSVNFIFQGGEPLLIGIEYYKSFFETCNILNKKNIKIYYSIQTNGTLITEEFAMLFKLNNVQIGVSLDGPEPIHNIYRDASFKDVMKGIELLKKHNVDFNVLTVITKANVSKASELYNFFKKYNFRFQQYIPYLEVSSIKGKKYQPTPKEYGEFLVSLFELWYGDFKKGNVYSISNFEDIIKNILNLGGTTCGMNGVCSLNLVIESDGSIYPCDFYTSDKDKLGNILEDTLSQLVHSIKGKHFIDESKSLHTNCLSCSYRNICKGGCKAYKNEDSLLFYCHSMKYLLSNISQELNDISRILIK